MSRLKKTPGSPQPLVFIWLKLLKSLTKIRARLAITIIAKKDIILKSVLHLEKMYQKTSNGLGNLHAND